MFWKMVETGRRRCHHKISVKSFCVFQSDFIPFMREKSATVCSQQWQKALVWSWPVNFLHRTKPGSSSEELFSLPLWDQSVCKDIEKRGLYSCRAGPAPLLSCFHSPRLLPDKRKLTSSALEDNSERPRAGEACQVEAGQRVRQSIWRERRVFAFSFTLTSTFEGWRNTR